MMKNQKNCQKTDLIAQKKCPDALNAMQNKIQLFKSMVSEKIKKYLQK